MVDFGGAQHVRGSGKGAVVERGVRMKPVRLGDRGAAVEDIQRRLRALGYDLGPTGIDGVFLGRTAEAVTAFQARHSLFEDGLVGDLTWATLVDATFALGDRALYLRMPHFHGNDVRTLQGALSALGFACGEVDGIFGTFTERAVREFQTNAGLPADGIVGDETAAALLQLRHAWEGREQRPHSAARGHAVRPAELLRTSALLLVALDDGAYDVVSRAANLAQADEPAARVRVTRETDELRIAGTVTLVVSTDGTGIAHHPKGEALDLEQLTARHVFDNVPPDGAVFSVIITTDGEDAHARQRAAVALLDAVCASCEA